MKYDLEERTTRFSETVIDLCKETEYWLRLLARSINDEKITNKCRLIWKETHELVLIFSTIAFKTK